MRKIFFEIFVFFVFLSHSTFSVAAENNKPNNKKEELPAIEESPPILKTLTPKEKKLLCSKFEGRLISYYDNVFKVEKCQRRPVLSPNTISSMIKNGAKVEEVNNLVIIGLAEGSPVDQDRPVNIKETCKKYDRQYITFSFVDVYFVEKCQKRLFKDWDSYIEHRKKHEPNSKTDEIAALSWSEFNSLKHGPEMPSIIDVEFKKLLEKTADVDIIPIDEACAGMNGRYVSYYSKVYKIEKCRKREITDLTFFSAQENKGFKIIEMTSEQWVSLPDGVPYDVPSAPTKPTN